MTNADRKDALLKLTETARQRNAESQAAAQALAAIAEKDRTYWSMKYNNFFKEYWVSLANDLKAAGYSDINGQTTRDISPDGFVYVIVATSPNDPKQRRWEVQGNTLKSAGPNEHRYTLTIRSGKGTTHTLDVSSGAVVLNPYFVEAMS